VIYLDSSVVLAFLLAEDRAPSSSFWEEGLTSSRLLQYEVFTRIYALGKAHLHADDARILIGQVSLVEMIPPVLDRVLEGFSLPVRTLDALHLATIEFLRSSGHVVQIASYDRRLAEAARALGVSAIPP